MFCPHCSAQQAEDDARFCEKCGSLLSLDAAPPACESEIAQADGFIPTSRPLGSEKGRPSTAKLIATIGAAVALLVAVVVAGYGVATGAVLRREAEPMQADQAGSPSQKPASHDAAEGGKDESMSAAISLADKDDYSRINLFLSNFSEVGVDTYDSAAPDAEVLAKFALYHVAYNSADAREFVSADSGSPWFPVTDPAGYDAVQNGYNVRVPSQVVADAVRSFLKIEFDLSALAGDYHYEDGFVYFRVANGTGYPSGVAVAQELADQGGGRFAVRYDVYGGFPYDATDTALYSLTEEELAAKLGVENPSYSAEAVLETGYEGELAPFKLVALRRVEPGERDSRDLLVRYRNARFGFCIDVPAEASVTESDNGAGMTCVDKTGFFSHCYLGEQYGCHDALAGFRQGESGQRCGV